MTQTYPCPQGPQRTGEETGTLSREVPAWMDVAKLEVKRLSRLLAWEPGRWWEDGENQAWSRDYVNPALAT